MEYLPGLSLEDLVERHGPLPPGRVVYLLRQVCGALREAHAAGLIHRDIKPSNVFAAHRGGMDDVAKLLDFGLVLPAAGPPAPHLTGEGQVLGTPLFMSPEQAMGGGRVVDERSDLYSLGAVAYYLLTGRPPFDGRERDRGHDRARPRPGGAALAGPRRCPRGPGARRAAVPGQGRRPSGSRMPRAWSGPWAHAPARGLGTGSGPPGGGKTPIRPPPTRTTVN